MERNLIIEVKYYNTLSGNLLKECGSVSYYSYCNIFSREERKKVFRTFKIKTKRNLNRNLYKNSDIRENREF